MDKANRGVLVTLDVRFPPVFPTTDKRCSPRQECCSSEGWRGRAQPFNVKGHLSIVCNSADSAISRFEIRDSLIDYDEYRRLKIQ